MMPGRPSTIGRQRQLRERLHGRPGPRVFVARERHRLAARAGAMTGATSSSKRPLLSAASALHWLPQGECVRLPARDAVLDRKDLGGLAP